MGMVLKKKYGNSQKKIKTVLIKNGLTEPSIFFFNNGDFETPQ